MKRLLRLATVTVLCAAVASALIACGGSDDNASPTARATTAGPATPAATTPRATVATGGNATPSADTPAAGGAVTPAAAPTTAAPRNQSLSVQAADFEFTVDKSSLLKNASVEVAFENNGDAIHTVTFYTDEDFTQKLPDGDSGRTSGGETKDFTFMSPASGDELYYRCEIHPTQMHGEIPLVDTDGE